MATVYAAPQQQGAPQQQMATVMNPMVMAPPQPQAMTYDAMLAGEGVMLKQLTNLCCGICCAQPNLHWTLHPYDSSKTYGFDDVFYNGVWVQEDSSFCGRTCSCAAPGSRATAFRTIEGMPNPGAPAVSSAGHVTHSKGCTLGTSQLVAVTQGGLVYVPCCCMLPYLQTTDEKGNVLGRTEMEFNICCAVPLMSVKDASGKKIYMIKSETCMGGCCVKCSCGGQKGNCCKIPFLIRDPVTMAQIDDAEITDLWSGFKNTTCTRKMLWSIKFPRAASKATRSVLVGSAILLVRSRRSHLALAPPPLRDAAPPSRRARTLPSSRTRPHEAPPF